jgi:Holliday junction resolvasome RuvABC endonuclease subunit
MMLLTIDPGTKTTGYAVFSIDEHNKDAFLIRTGHFKGRHKEWIPNVDQIVCSFDCAQFRQVDQVLIEQPQLFISSNKGRAASNSGAVIKLMALAFSLRQLFILTGYQVQMVPVNTWKGQLPKVITARRMKKHWNHSSSCNDETDAVGIGDWYIRKQLQYTPSIYSKT